MKKNIVFILLLSAIYLLAQNGSKKFTIDELWSSPKFSSKAMRGIQWCDKGRNFTYLDLDSVTKSFNIYKYEVNSKKRSLFVSASDLKLNNSDQPFRIMNYSYSPNEKYILFTGMLPARRLKTGGSIFLYEIATKTFREIETQGSTMNVKFSPDETKIGYVLKDNIYVYDISTGLETQLTFDGSETILNGHFDWVYEEEFGINDGWQFSKDGKEIAFWSLDQSKVPQIEIQQFDSLYFNSIKMRYPKAGGTNSTVKIGVIDISSGKRTWMDLGAETDIYIPRISWTETPGVLAIQRMNRLQTKLEILLADTKTGQTKTIYNEEDTTWVDIEGQTLYFLKDKKHFIITSEKDGFRHLYLYDLNGNIKHQITKGKWETGTYIKVDEQNNLIYFTSGMGNPLITNLYRVKIKGGEPEQITKDKGTSSFNISPAFICYVRNLSDVNTPSRQLLETSQGKLIEILEENSKLKSILSEYSFSMSEFITFKTSDGVVLNAQIIKPKDFDPSKKYPVMIYNYSGPTSQTVRDVWGGNQSLWHHMLAQSGYIVFAIDGRGTGGRGKEFSRIVYKNLGYWEVKDQIEAVKYLTSLTYIDPSRIGIWGWSYGGYAAIMTMLDAADYFKLGVAVAPVTAWDFYDTIYSERYMSTPQLNPEGYKTSSAVQKADKLKGKLMIIHGTADDNVHFQNTVVLTDELIKANKQFDVMFYPGKDHGIYGGKTREQLFTKITNYILQNL